MWIPEGPPAPPAPLPRAVSAANCEWSFIYIKRFQEGSLAGSGQARDRDSSDVPLG